MSLRRMVALTVALALAAVTTSGQVAGAVSPPEVRPLVIQMARAVGGQQQLDQIETLHVEAAGTRWVLDEDLEPGGGAGVAGAYELTSSVDARTGQLRLDYDINSSRFGPRQISEIVDADGGYLIGQNSLVAPPVATAMSHDRLVSTQVHQLLMNPQILVKALSDGLAVARAAGTVDLRGVSHDLLLVDREGASPLRVFVHPATKLISQIATVESDPLRRDVRLVVRYNNWQQVDGDLRVPLRVRVFYDSELIQEETRTSVVVNGPLAAGIFDPPSGATPVFDALLASRGVNSHQHLQSFAALGFPLDGLQLDVTAVELAPGVHWLSGGTHHSMLVEHDDGLALVDAPLNEYRAQALLDFIAANFGDRPITHVVQSHHHADHSAGARTVLATGADLAVHRSARQFWSEIVTARSRVVPDALALSPTNVRILGVPHGGSRTIGSGDNAVELHSFEQNHADDLLLVVAGGVAFIVDFYNPFPGAPIPPEGQVILDLIAERGLEVHTIAGGHGAFVSVPPG